MVDVKTSTGGWDKMKTGLGGLIGSGVWGKGVIDDLKEVNKYMEKAEEKIQEKDTDGVISFSHTSKKSKYTDLFEKLEVLHGYSKVAHGLVEEHIDDPFYKAIDGYVEAMEQLSITSYSTDNTIGTTEIVMTSVDGYTFDTQTKKKDKITADDLFADDAVLGKQMKKDFNEYKTKYQGDKDEMLDYKDFKASQLHTGAFSYKSIKDKQLEKEMWVNIGLSVATLVVGVICPPAGAVLGLTIALAEGGSALAGKDWISGRELSKDEVATRLVLSAVSVAFDVSALNSFSKATRHANAFKHAATGGANKLDHLSDMVLGAKELAKSRVTSFGNSLKSLPTKLKNGYNGVKTQISNVKNVVVDKASQSFGKLQDAWEQGRTSFEQARKNFQNGFNNLHGNNRQLVADGIPFNVIDDGEDVLRMANSGGSVGKKASGADDIFKSTPELENHLKYTDPTVPRKRGIGGAHNSEEFFKNDVKIVSQKPTDVPGVSVVEYQIPELDMKGLPTGNYKKTVFKKSIYDPSIMPDDEYVRRGLEAANNAAKNNNGSLPREWVGKDSSGKVWRGYFKDGKPDSFFPD